MGLLSYQCPIVLSVITKQKVWKMLQTFRENGKLQGHVFYRPLLIPILVDYLV